MVPVQGRSYPSSGAQYICRRSAHPTRYGYALGGDEGYLTAVDVIARSGVEAADASNASMERRLQQATSACGGSSASIACGFPLRQPGVQQTAKQFLDGWDRANDGHGYDRLIEHIVGRIRQWRPEVVIASSPSSSSVDPLEQLIGQSVLQAVDYAADSTRYSHQLIDVGLMPWQVRKVYAALPEGERGTLEVVGAQIATRLGNSLSDISSGPAPY